MEFNENGFGNKRPPRRKKVHWDRVIAAFLIFLLITYLLIKAVGALIRAGKDSSSSQTDSSSQVQSSVAESSPSSSEPETYGNYNITVCVDPGHGDYDAGTVNEDKTRLEKDDNLKISLKLRDYLKKYGVNVVMTRDTDTFVELEDRTDIANEQKCDFFICMHRNAYTGDMKGVEIWVNNAEPKEDTALANNILTELEKVGISNNRGVCYGYVGDNTINYHVNIYTYMPSCLIELGFLTDETDNKDFDAHMDEYAKAIADAIVKSAVDLGVTDKNGNRLIEGPFFTNDKKLAPDAQAQKPQTADKPYNTQENEY